MVRRLEAMGRVLADVDTAVHATEQDEVKVLANNLPIASGVVVVNRNRIAVEVKQMLPRTPDNR